jgi:hypothetical protein
MDELYCISKAFLISFIPAVVASLALAFSVLGNTWCESITFNSSSDQLPSVNYGIWYLQKTVVEDLIGNRIVEVAKCLDYPESMDIDAKWKTARAFSIIAPVIGGFITFFSWLAPCMYYGKDMWKQGGGWLIVVAIFQGFTLFFLGSNACVDNPLVRSMGYDDTCVMDWGTHLSITSVVCWFMAGVAMMFVIPAPTRPKPPPPETQTVTYTQTEEADGTKVIHTSVVKGTYVAATEEQPISLATTV